uniref:Uncharacterized protein n=1 Tax=Octopus bimaculoides TaxID=37653 RepID=A0A0L8FTU0_OCTBM
MSCITSNSMRLFASSFTEEFLKQIKILTFQMKKFDSSFLFLFTNFKAGCSAVGWSIDMVQWG